MPTEPRDKEMTKKLVEAENMTERLKSLEWSLAKVPWLAQCQKLVFRLKIDQNLDELMAILENVAASATGVVASNVREGGSE